MPRHEEGATLAYRAEELFTVVANIRDYPSFVPGAAARVFLREDPQQIIARPVIGFGPFQETFRSQVTLDRPRQVTVQAIEDHWSISTIFGHSRRSRQGRMSISS